jgi:hypothetical protein
MNDLHILNALNTFNELHTYNELHAFNELHTWLSQQHHGLRTFRAFQQKLDDVSRADPGQRALCRLLDTLVGSYVDRFDEEPLPVEVADLAYQRLLDLVASLDLNAGSDRRMADNRVAACDLRH